MSQSLYSNSLDLHVPLLDETEVDCDFECDLDDDFDRDEIFLSEITSATSTSHNMSARTSHQEDEEDLEEEPYSPKSSSSSWCEVLLPSPPHLLGARFLRSRR